MAYKKLIKVSNVCQLLDKSKYPATQTIDGVTFTNNGDGTITLDGTGNVYSAYNFLLAGTLNETHKYLFTAATQPCSWGQTYGMTCTDNTSVGFDSGNGKFFTNEKRFALVAYVWKQHTASNLVFKPQLFDLTEMYGAGHEPTSVEQFRQDFPEELYDYSPHCWLTSYKRVFMTGEGNYLTSYESNLTCKTKNLLSFPYYSSYVTKNGITFSQVETYKVHASGINTDSVGTTFDFVYGKTFKAGTYTIKFYTEGNVTTDLYYRVRKDSYYGTPIDSDQINQKTFTLSEDTILFISFGFVGAGTPLYTGEELNVTVYCQLELGNTATGYVPYGHL